MKIHIAKQGDTLNKLSQKYNVGLQQLIEMNPRIEKPEQIEVGKKVKIPSAIVPVEPPSETVAYKHIVKQGDTLWKLSQSWGVPLSALIKMNPQLKNPNVLMTGETVYIPKAGTEAPHYSNMNAAGNPYAAAPVYEENVNKGGNIMNMNLPNENPPDVAAENYPNVPLQYMEQPVVEHKSDANPVYSKEMENKINDLFIQYKVPATEAAKMNGMPESSYPFPPIPSMSEHNPSAAPYGSNSNIHPPFYTPQPQAYLPATGGPCGCDGQSDYGPWMMPGNPGAAEWTPYGTSPYGAPQPYSYPYQPQSGGYADPYGMPYGAAPYGSPYGILYGNPYGAPDLTYDPGFVSAHSMDTGPMRGDEVKAAQDEKADLQTGTEKKAEIRQTGKKQNTKKTTKASKNKNVRRPVKQQKQVTESMPWINF